MSYHQTTVMGNLGQDPEEFVRPNGDKGCNFSVATTERWKKDGEDQEHTEWYRVTVYGKQAEACIKYLTKGSEALIAGRMRTTKKDDKYYTNLLASTVRFGRSKQEDSSSDAPF